METDSVLVNRRILDEESLNCKEKFALVILSDSGEISYDRLARKMGVTTPTAFSTVKNLEKKGFLRYIPKLDRNQRGSTVTNQYFVTI